MCVCARQDSPLACVTEKGRKGLGRREGEIGRERGRERGREQAHAACTGGCEREAGREGAHFRVSRRMGATNSSFDGGNRLHERVDGALVAHVLSPQHLQLNQLLVLPFCFRCAKVAGRRSLSEL